MTAAHDAERARWVNEPQPLTIVIVTPDDPGNPSPELAGTLYSIQQQRGYPADMVDTNIVRDVGDYTTTELRVYGANHAKTEWLVFVEPGDIWMEDRLSTLWEMLYQAQRFHNKHGVAVTHPITGAVTFLVDREYYLHRAEVGS